MSSVRFVLGAEADIASTDDVRAAVKSGTDSILTGLRSTRHMGNRRRIPASVSVGGAGGTGAFVLDFGSPQGGSLWWIVEVVVTAADDRTAPAGTVAALYCGAPARQATGTTVLDLPPLGALVRPAIAVPGTFQFSKEAWPVKDGESLFAVVYAPTTAVTVTSGVATVMEIDSSLVSLNRM